MKFLTQPQARKLFGDFKSEVTDNGQVIIDDGWIAKNLNMVHIPQLQGVPTYGGKLSSGNVYCHVAIHNQLKAAFQEIEDLGYLDDIIFWGGCFNPRMIRGSFTDLSMHCWGVAFDINPAQNRLGKEPAADGENGCLLRLIKIFEKHGFGWGGNFKRKDGMHFEAVKIIDYSAPSSTDEKIDNIIAQLQDLKKCQLS